VRYNKSEKELMLGNFGRKGVWKNTYALILRKCCPCAAGGRGCGDAWGTATAHVKKGLRSARSFISTVEVLKLGI
jgi:hypothetical protein